MADQVGFGFAHEGFHTHPMNILASLNRYAIDIGNTVDSFTKYVTFNWTLSKQG